MEVREENTSDAGECRISIDGTWQKRCHMRLKMVQCRDSDLARF